jgi:hypothetical protein
MAQWDPRILGVIPDRIGRGIEVVDFRKHWGIDPHHYTPDQLQRLTNPLGRGSKWLASLSDPVKFEMIWRVLEVNGASMNLGGQPRIYRSTAQPHPVGVSHGRLMNSFEVRFDGRRYAPAYPCDS